MESTSGNETRNILVADSGGSKAAWKQIIDGKIIPKEITTSGLNAFFLDEEGICEWVKKELLPQLEDQKVNRLYFYGSGLNYPDNIKKLKSAFSKIFPGAFLEIKTDTLGAAKSLCQKERGIGCIIGTGSSACLYDGNDIIEDRSGLGYALGDEASGSYFGKKILRSYLYGQLSPKIRESFIEMFGNLSRDDILEAVYKKPFPSRFMAKFTTLLSANRGDEFVEKTLEDGFEEFINCSIKCFKDYKELKVGFVGSISLVFRDALEKVLKKNGIQAGVFLQTPIDGLVKYHLENS